jgi:hypothetical protein
MIFSRKPVPTFRDHALAAPFVAQPAHGAGAALPPQAAPGSFFGQQRPLQACRLVLRDRHQCGDRTAVPCNDRGATLLCGAEKLRKPIAGFFRPFALRRVGSPWHDVHCTAPYRMAQPPRVARMSVSRCADAWVKTALRKTLIFASASLRQSLLREHTTSECTVVF